MTRAPRGGAGGNICDTPPSGGDTSDWSGCDVLVVTGTSRGVVVTVARMVIGTLFDDSEGHGGDTGHGDIL